MSREKKYFLILACLYAVLFIFKKSGIYFPWISDYAADFICIPLVVTSIQLIIHKFTGKPFKIESGHVFVAILYFTLVFELWMPTVSRNYTSDPLDILCYFTGGLLYLIVFKIKLSTHRI